jgi:hypothetical protein
VFIFTSATSQGSFFTRVKQPMTMVQMQQPMTMVQQQHLMTMMQQPCEPCTIADAVAANGAQEV